MGGRFGARWVGNGVWLVATLALQTVQGGALDREQVLERLQDWLTDTRDFQCRFEQELISGAFGSGIREYGRLYVKRPGKMRWEYTKPEAKVALLNGDRALVYLPLDRQLIRGGEGWSDGLLAALLTGSDRLDTLFESQLVATPETGGEGRYRLRLVPRTLPEGLEAVTLTIAPPSFSIEEAEVLDEAGNRMRYSLRGLRRNRGLREALFELKPPPGTEILDPS